MILIWHLCYFDASFIRLSFMFCLGDMAAIIHLFVSCYTGKREHDSWKCVLGTFSGLICSGVDPSDRCSFPWKDELDPRLSWIFHVTELTLCASPACAWVVNSACGLPLHPSPRTRLEINPMNVLGGCPLRSWRRVQCWRKGKETIVENISYSEVLRTRFFSWATSRNDGLTRRAAYGRKRTVAHYYNFPYMDRCQIQLA